MKQQEQIQGLQEYAGQLKAHLVQVMQKVTILTNQITTMEQAHEDQVSKVLHSIRESEMERIRIQVESNEKLQTLEHEKQLREQALLSKLEHKNEKLLRLEEYIEELRDALASTTTTAATAAAAATSSVNASNYSSDTSMPTTTPPPLTPYQQIHQEEKGRMVQQHRCEVERLRAEVKKLNCENERLEHAVERWKDLEDALNQSKTLENDFWIAECHSKSWSRIPSRQETDEKEVVDDDDDDDDDINHNNDEEEEKSFSHS